MKDIKGLFSYYYTYITRIGPLLSLDTQLFQTSCLQSPGNVVLHGKSTLACDYKRQHHNQALSPENAALPSSAAYQFGLIGDDQKVQLLLKHHFVWKFCNSWSCLVSFVQLVVSVSLCL